MIQVVALPGLAGTAVPPAIVCDAPVAARCQEEHLVFEGIGREGPAMTEHDWLSSTPIRVVDADTIFRGKRIWHSDPPELQWVNRPDR